MARRRSGRVRTVFVRAKRRASAKHGILGGKSFMNLAIGGAAHAGVATIIPPVAGDFQGALDKVIVGLVPGQKDMMSAGIKEGISVGLRKYVVPRLGGLFGGGNGTQTTIKSNSSAFVAANQR